MTRPTFPKTLREFQSQFATEEACQKYLAACRWPDGFVWPRCGNRGAYELLKLSRWQCAGCRHQISVTAQTILHNTKMPLTVWFWAGFTLMNSSFATIGAGNPWRRSKPCSASEPDVSPPHIRRYGAARTFQCGPTKIECYMFGLAETTG